MRFKLFAEEEKDFFPSVADFSLTFQADAQGDATGLTLHQNGDHEVKRID